MILYRENETDYLFDPIDARTIEVGSEAGIVVFAVICGKTVTFDR